MTAEIARTLTVRLPSPPADLAPNRTSHRHWRYRQQAAKQYRATCFIVAAMHRPSTFGPPMERATLSVRFAWCGRRHALDADGALGSWKAGLDSLVDAGLLAGDEAHRVSFSSIESAHCPPRCRCGGGVTVEIAEALR